MSHPAAKLSRRKKAVFAAIALTAFAILLEIALGVAGVRPLYLTQDPFVGFQPGVPLFVRDGDFYCTNPSKTCYFNVQRFPATKGASTYRVFCLGGSTTFGHPYDYRTSLSNWLGERLRDAEPDRQWEVINCGGISYAGYRVCLLMQELVQYQPDLFVILTGHNEFLEQRTYGELRDRNWAARALGSLVVRTRTGSVIASLAGARPSPPDGQEGLLPGEVDTILEHSVGPAAYRRDDKLAAQVVEHFRFSLDRMAAIARSAGARVIFVKPPSNVRGFSPFKSEHGDLGADGQRAWQDLVRKARHDRAEGRVAAAIEGFLAAARLDPRHAHGQWEAGDALVAAGRYDEARAYFARAVDEDICPLRATSAIQAAVEEAAQAHRAPLIDFPQLLEDAMPGPVETHILGDESFLDHVHPTIEGHRLLAWALFDQLAAWNVVSPQPSDAAVVQRVSQRALAGIDARAQALALVQVIQVLVWAGKEQEALRLTERAEQVCPGLSEVPSYRGRILQKLGQDAEAMKCFREAVRRNPDDSLALSRVAFAALKENQFETARAYFATAVLRTPPSAPLSFRTSLRMGLGITFAELRQWKEAKLEFQAVLRMAPDLAEAKRRLEQVEAELAQPDLPRLPGLEESKRGKTKQPADKVERR